MIRRCDVTDNAWVFAWLEMKCLITNQRDTALTIGLRQITLSVLVSHKINLGSVDQGALELSPAQFGGAILE